MLRKEDIEGLDAEAIQKKYALPRRPDTGGDVLPSQAGQAGVVENFYKDDDVGGHRFYKPNEPEKPRSEAAASK